MVQLAEVSTFTPQSEFDKRVIVERLEELLAAARAGHVRGVIYSYIDERRIIRDYVSPSLLKMEVSLQLTYLQMAFMRLLAGEPEILEKPPA